MTAHFSNEIHLKNSFKSKLLLAMAFIFSNSGFANEIPELILTDKSTSDLNRSYLKEQLTKFPIQLDKNTCRYGIDSNYGKLFYQALQASSKELPDDVNNNFTRKYGIFYDLPTYCLRSFKRVHPLNLISEHYCKALNGFGVSSPLNEINSGLSNHCVNHSKKKGYEKAEKDAKKWIGIYLEGLQVWSELVHEKANLKLNQINLVAEKQRKEEEVLRKKQQEEQDRLAKIQQQKKKETERLKQIEIEKAKAAKEEEARQFEIYKNNVLSGKEKLKSCSPKVYNSIEGNRLLLFPPIEANEKSYQFRGMSIESESTENPLLFSFDFGVVGNKYYGKKLLIAYTDSNTQLNFKNAYQGGICIIGTLTRVKNIGGELTLEIDAKYIGK
ncbi:hypothetical protein ACFODZ_03040 [Marinicella sediminis]|uniref:Uncharacterized protein n=1 Tax=Marinicella sediminis TaxID=1792834 RepID=A0ABV7J988_9GAMM|nr:hypothetical protein [Marinicella sediminis]